MHIFDVFTTLCSDCTKLTLEELGEGINTSVVMGVLAKYYEKSIVCIEEPETHLHPSAQRLLMDFFLNHTSNQYFIATHSAHIINTIQGEHAKDKVRIFQIKQKEGESAIQAVDCDQNMFNMLSDLGYQAADILQTNCLIMVEGPSDKIYLRAWIEAFMNLCQSKKRSEEKFRIQEGIHYQFLQSGGNAFFSKTEKPDTNNSAETDEEDDYIDVEDNDDEDVEFDKEKLAKLLSLNRNIVAVLDCDLDHAPNNGHPENEGKIYQSKHKMISEINGSASLEADCSWITDGREIENYISRDLMTKLLKIIYSGTNQNLLSIIYSCSKDSRSSENPQRFANFTDKKFKKRKLTPKSQNDLQLKVNSASPEFTERSIDKVQVARWLCSEIEFLPKFSLIQDELLTYRQNPFVLKLDGAECQLEDRIRALVKFILHANHLDLTNFDFLDTKVS